MTSDGIITSTVNDVYLQSSNDHAHSKIVATMATNEQQHHLIHIAPSSPPSSSWAPLAPSAASIGWENSGSKPSSIQTGYKRLRLSPPTQQQLVVQKQKRRNVNNNTNDKAIKVAKQSENISSEGYSCALQDQGDTVLTFTQGCAVCIVGRAQICLQEGIADIMGYGLDSSHHHAQSVRVESPSWNSLITIRADANTRLCISSVGSNQGRFSKSYSVCSYYGKGIRPTVLPSSWVKAADDILLDLISRRQQHQQGTDIEPNSSESTNPTSCIFLCGAKGVGKSTCLRYIANRVLSAPVGRWDRVAILDADVGQPELSPPGMITLTILRRPLLSPPHLHMVMGSDSEAEEMPVQFSYFFGNISPKMDPQRYLHCIQFLRDRYHRLVEQEYEGDPLQLPLLVNTDGWVKGLGFQILTTLLADTLQPRHVVQIQGEVRSKMFELDETIVTGKSKLHMALPYNGGETISCFPSSATDTAVRLSASSIPSLAWRSLRFCTYFLGDATVWDETVVSFGNLGITDDDHVIARRLAAMAPYVVPMEAVKCHLLGDDAGDMGSSETAMWQVLNGSIVGLCLADDDNDSALINSLPCVGLGLIRALDPARRLFYVLTPVDANTLQSVNAFVIGNLQLPIECLFRGRYSESFPFLSCEGLAMGVLGADPMKSRNNIARKGFSNPGP